MNRFSLMIYNIYVVYIINFPYEISNIMFVTGVFGFGYPTGVYLRTISLSFRWVIESADF